jgi:pyruvate/2-oxoglutarate dehydrogenase complex dihydrolipoamide acyltransferase (E2) component
MFGISQFTAVINPPQVAILAVGTSQSKLNIDLKKQTEMTLCLCYDERCVSVDRAKTFLNSLNYFIANPDLLVEKTQDF